jgi:hypothetical protein
MPPVTETTLAEIVVLDPPLVVSTKFETERPEVWSRLHFGGHALEAQSGPRSCPVVRIYSTPGIPMSRAPVWPNHPPKGDSVLIAENKRKSAGQPEACLSPGRSASGGEGE